MSVTTTVQADPIAANLTTVTVEAPTEGDPPDVEQASASGGSWFMFDIDNTGNSDDTYVKYWEMADDPSLGSDAPEGIFLVRAKTRITYTSPAGTAFSAGLQVTAVTAGGTAGTTGMAGDVVVRILHS